MSARRHSDSMYCSFVRSISCSCLRCSSASEKSPNLSAASADLHKYSRCLRMLPFLTARLSCTCNHCCNGTHNAHDDLSSSSDPTAMQLQAMLFGVTHTSCSKVCCASPTSPLAIWSSAKPSQAARLELSCTIASLYSALPLFMLPRQNDALPAQLYVHINKSLG